MRPDENKPIHIPSRQVTTSPPARASHAQQTAAANLVRGQIDHIYNNDNTPDETTHSQPVTAHSKEDNQPTAVYSDGYAARQTTPIQQPADNENPYERTHTEPRTTPAGDWQQYHSAWQNYYQKYYEQYYVGAVNQVHTAYSKKADEIHQQNQAFKDNNDGTLSEDEAMYDLRKQLLSKVQESSKKVRKSRHFIPLVAALSVLLVFGFLQYNRVIISNVKAYVTPGEIDPQNIIVDPNASIQVSKEPRIIIPKINVNAPVDYSASPDNDSQMKAMENGVAYFGIPGANSKPGQVGNTPLSGHSSNDFIDNGNFKFVFALLERMKKNDTFYLNYEGTRYTYKVTKIQVVLPTEVDALTFPTDKPLATLITCTPLGTAEKRLLVIGEQISPNPEQASSAPEQSEAAESAMPGNSPTLFERIFGG